LRNKTWPTRRSISRSSSSSAAAPGQARRRVRRRILARKSELINAIFFADFGQRLLPSSAGRTTMCPTELLYETIRPPSIRLLPIETRLKDATVAEFKNYADEWVTIPLDLSSADRMSEALSRVSQVKRVPVQLARKYGLYDDEDYLAALESEGEGAVDIPCWRHAVINFPHPLLQQGLVILDTPGLNAIGTEPELTLNLLPNAHAVLFILAADAGVTKTDLDVWSRHLAGEDPATKAGRIVILNKIDGLWDELRSDADVDAEIGRQLKSSAQLLGISPAQVFAVSAQKALLAKVNGDDALLAKSRLPVLEDALSRKLIPAKRDIVGAATQAEVKVLAAGVRAARCAPERHRRAADRVARPARQEPGRRRAHDGPRARGEGAVRARAAAVHRAAHGVRAADEPAFRRDRARRAAHQCREDAAPHRGQPVHQGRAHRDECSSRRSAATSRRRRAALRDSRHDAGDVRAFRQGAGARALRAAAVLDAEVSEEIDRLERAYNQHFNTLWNMVSKAKFALMKPSSKRSPRASSTSTTSRTATSKAGYGR
jgi:hypothetical protein